MKTHIKKRSLCIALTLSLLLTFAAAATYGTKKGGTSLQLASGATLYDGVWSDSGTLQSENYIEYTPGSSSKPIVAYGSKLYGTSTYETVADYLATQGATVIAAINGDFFNTTSGLPNGIVVTDGIIRGSDGYQNAVGFRSDGTAVIGRPSMNMHVQLPSGTLPLFSINRALSSSGIFLYTSDYSATTRASLKALYVTIRPTSGELTLSGSVTATVVSSKTASSAVSIPDDCMILAVTADNSNHSTLSALSAGDSVTITVSCADGWSDVDYAIGGYQLLVENGKVASGLTAEEAPRTAVGIKADRTVVFYTVDGRQAGCSTGVGLKDVAERLIELGCTTAVNLDGGGSTAVGVIYPGMAAIETANSPSDGSLRKCANFIFLVNTATSSGTANSLHLYPYSENVLAGATVNFRTGATDSGWYAAAVPGIPSYSATGGTITQAGVWTAPDNAGTCTVSVSAGGLRANTTLNVVASPDTVDIRKGTNSVGGKSLTVAAGSTTDFSGAVRNDGLWLLAQDEQLTWSVTGGIGTVDGSGVFTAADLEAGGSGTLVVNYGSVSARVSITVSGDAVVLEDFEDLAFFNMVGDSASLSLCSDLANVKYRTHSALLTYSNDEADQPATAPYTLSLADGFEWLCLWVKGDGSGNTLCATLSETAPPLELTTLENNSWKFVAVKLPSDAACITGFSVVPPDGEALSSGAVYIDMIYQSKSCTADTQAPTIAFTQNGASAAATVLDGGRGVPMANLRVTLDREELSFTYNVTNGLLTPVVPELTAGEHLLTVTASDAYGNARAATLSLSGGSTTDPFSDTDGHWAKQYITYLAGRGIVTGSLVNGSNVFRPDDKITRAEFATILCRWLGADTAKYANVTLPFEDASSIPIWALPYVKAMYSLGIVTGSSENGHLLFKANANITRAQAMTMLGRTQAMGYAEAALDFDDAASVPAWAAPFIRTLVQRGVVNGSGGLIKPSGNASRAEVAKMIYAMG